MENIADMLARPSIASLNAYSSARDEYSGSNAIFLDANENPFNAPYNRYPDPHQQELKKRIAQLKNVPVEQIFLGNGSDEAIDILMRIFCEPGKDNIVSISPTYGMYRVCADINNVELREVPLNNDYSLDIAGLRNACDKRTKMLFLCSPNNPTSNSFDPAEMLSLVNGLNVMLVVDEAYIDFSSRISLVQSVDSVSNLVVLQTFSKAWGLAGIRLGMAISNSQVIRYMSKVKYPYNLNMLTQEFAMKALENHVQVKDWIRMILEERRSLERKLKKLRFVEHIYPSDANFLLVKVAGPKKVYTYLVEKKIIVRDRSNVKLCENSLRITIGTADENEKLMGALLRYQEDFIDSCSLNLH